MLLISPSRHIAPLGLTSVTKWLISLAWFRHCFVFSESHERFWKSSMYNCNTTVGLGNFSVIGVLHRGNDLTNIFKASVRVQSSCGFYALKMFPKTKRGIAAFTNEREILREIYTAHNPYIVELDRLLQTPSGLLISLEYLENGSLRKHLDVEGTFSENRVAYYSACVLCALQYLHCSRVTHGDVHLRNMMLDGHGKLKLIDFGRSQLCLGVSVFGTPNFYSDLRQLGLSIYEMLSGQMVMYPDMKLIKKECVSGKALKLIENLIEFENKSNKPDDDRSFLSSSFFKAINVKQLEKGSLTPSKFNKQPEHLLELQLKDLEFDSPGDPLLKNIVFDDLPFVECVFTNVAMDNSN